VYARDLIILALAAVGLAITSAASGAEEWDDGIARTARNHGPIPLMTLGVEYENFAIGPHATQGELVLRVCRDPQAGTDVTVAIAVPQQGLTPRNPQNPQGARVSPSTQLELKQLNFGCGDIEGGQFFMKLLESKFAGLAGIIEPQSSSGWANVRLSEGYSGDHVLINVRTPQKYVIEIPKLAGENAYKVQFEVYNTKWPSGRKVWLRSDGNNRDLVQEATKIVVLQTKFDDERDATVPEKTIRYARCDSSEVTCKKRGGPDSWLEDGQSSD
jgi:hypothetical protein